MKARMLVCIGVSVVVLVLAACGGGGPSGPICMTFDNGCTCAEFNYEDGTEVCRPADHGPLAQCCMYDYGDGSTRDDGAYGLECACVRPVCLLSEMSAYCSCSATLYSFDIADREVDECRAAVGQTCCLDGIDCFCVDGATECLGGGTPVAACDPTMVGGCHEGGVAVDTCE
jgi:hypothetical protein